MLALFKKKIFIASFTVFFLVINILVTNVSLAQDKSLFQTQNNYRFNFKKLPRHFAHDFKESFWGVNGIVFVLATGAAVAFHPLDNDVKNQISKGQVFSDDFNSTISTVLEPLVYGGASIITLIIANETGRPKLSLAMESVIESWLITLALTGATKLAINRTRPNGGNYSMPSGHTSAAFSTATVLTSFYGVKAAIPCYFLAGLVSFSRIDSQHHFLTDVLVGAVLGTAIGLGTSSFHKKEHPNYFISPMVSSHGTGLVFHKTF